MKNGRPANIFPLLLGVRHPLARNKIEFEKRYCNARKTRFCPWDTTGAAHLPELRELIGPKLLRKTKVGIGHGIEHGIEHGIGYSIGHVIGYV
jgi:hypothetical protein